MSRSVKQAYPIILPEPKPEPIYCPAQTFVGNRIEPAEYCDNEVADYGQLCEVHDAIDRSDADYENYLESLRK